MNIECTHFSFHCQRLRVGAFACLTVLYIFVAHWPNGINRVLARTYLFSDSNEHVTKNKTVFITSNENLGYVNCHFNCRGTRNEIGIVTDLEVNGHVMELSLPCPGETGEIYKNLNHGRHEPVSSEYKSRASPLRLPIGKSGKRV